MSKKLFPKINYSVKLGKRGNSSQNFNHSVLAQVKNPLRLCCPPDLAFVGILDEQFSYGLIQENRLENASAPAIAGAMTFATITSSFPELNGGNREVWSLTFDSGHHFFNKLLVLLG